jgi:hypothetical protein
MRKITTKPKYDRKAVMRDAHRQWRQSQRLGLGWSWGKCISRAWEAAKGREVFRQQNAKIKRDIIRLAA